jgi:hypothetical protein
MKSFVFTPLAAPFCFSDHARSPDHGDPPPFATSASFAVKSFDFQSSLLAISGDFGNLGFRVLYRTSGTSTHTLTA